MLKPDLYYGWNRKTDEFLANSGWSTDPDKAFGVHNRFTMWNMLERASSWWDKDDLCVSLGADLITDSSNTDTIT